MRKHLILLTVALCHSSILWAGWYNCRTYEGEVAGAKVHVYLQFFDKHGASKDTIAVSGIYVYDKLNDPLVLKGSLIKSTVLELTEYHDGDAFAKLTLQWTEDSLTGTWQSSQKMHKVSLSQIGLLTDVDEAIVNPPTEILMRDSFQSDYFLAVYYKGKDDTRARMAEVRVIDKKTRVIKHIIKFEKDEWPVGNVSTVIFENIRGWEPPRVDTRALEIEVDDGHMGQSYFMTYDPVQGKFVKDL
ncbi:hypothetical protein RT717_13360 [Imperialibacter roseus]|uniref:NigD-like protein n=1 Tax=Imperialibacter roseus TaxID=1324217 RepID=A0ABZ0IX53_9BACT|nr:hypothetical protein [Imperialibacter roseus]WOK09628.1 hypothetical protein RT717_13360 [Imperialibacter roseus]